MSVTVPVDGFAFNIVHHKVRQALFGAAAVDELYDVWMVKRSKRLPLITKSTEDLVGICVGPHHLDGYLLSIKLIISFAEIYDCHAAVSNHADNAIVSALSSQHGVGLDGEKPGERRALKKAVGAATMSYERFHFGE